MLETTKTSAPPPPVQPQQQTLPLPPPPPPPPLPPTVMMYHQPPTRYPVNYGPQASMGYYDMYGHPPHPMYMQVSYIWCMCFFIHLY